MTAPVSSGSAASPTVSTLASTPGPASTAGTFCAATSRIRYRSVEALDVDPAVEDRVGSHSSTCSSENLTSQDTVESPSTLERSSRFPTPDDHGAQRSTRSTPSCGRDVARASRDFFTAEADDFLQRKFTEAFDAPFNEEEPTDDEERSVWWEATTLRGKQCTLP